MIKVLLIVITIIMMVSSGIFLGKFYLTQLNNVSEYYLLTLCILFTIVGVVSWWSTFKHS